MASTGTIPKSEAGEAGGDFNPFLRTVLHKVGQKMKVTLTGNMRLTESQFGAQIMVEVKAGGKLYDFPVRVDSPNHRKLETFGTNSRKWKGKAATLECRKIKGYAPSIYFAD